MTDRLTITTDDLDSIVWAATELGRLLGKAETSTTTVTIDAQSVKGVSQAATFFDDLERHVKAKRRRSDQQPETD